MTGVIVEQTQGSRSSVLVPLFAVAGVVLVLLVASAIYFRAGWWRMESACEQDGQGKFRDSVAYDWSWKPLGFQCTFGDGDTRTSLWF